jgi:hypothetical protein
MINETYYPLLEAFDALDREIAARELRERQATCLHDDQAVGHQSDATWMLCAKCGRVTAGVGEYTERTRADLDDARTRADFLPTLRRL